MAARAARVAAAGGGGGRRWASRGWRRWPSTSRSIPRAASRPSAISPRCSTATRCTGRSSSAPGRPLAGRAVAAPARADRGARPRGPARDAPARGCGPSRASSTCPERLSLFGLTRLPAGQLGVLRALAEHRDVHLFLLHPSPALWERIALEAPRVVAPRRGPDGHAGRATACSPPGGRTRASCSSYSGRTSTTHEHPVEHRSDTLLARLQAAVRDDAPPAPGAADAQHPGPRLPRPRAPGRGHARRDPAPARRGPDARAARRDRHVPGHRGVRAADPGDVRRGGDPTRTTSSTVRGPPAGPARAARRPLAAPDQPGARRRRAAARARRASG